MGKIKDITGEKYAKLTAEKFVSIDPKGNGAIWTWRCECNNTIDLKANRVKYQQFKDARRSCGCWNTNPRINYFGIDALIYKVYTGNYNDGDLTFEEFKEMSQQNCYYCDASPSNKEVNRNNKEIKWVYNGLDAVNNDEAHNKNNIVPCCWLCNKMKSNMVQEEFLAWIERVYKHCVEKI